MSDDDIIDEIISLRINKKSCNHKSWRNKGGKKWTGYENKNEIRIKMMNNFHTMSE